MCVFTLDDFVLQGGIFYFNKRNQIVVVTTHFSGYFCAYCEANKLPMELNVVLFARDVLKNRGQRVIDMRLELWDKRLECKDFEKVHILLDMHI